MANYDCATRTNYFGVNDEEGFQNFMKKVYGNEDDVSVWTIEDENGDHKFAFGCCGAISGLKNENDEDDDDTYDDFLDGLQRYVAEDDAILIFEAGHEKMRYVIGSVTVITSKEIVYKDIMRMGHEIACRLLNNDKWETRCDY